MSPEDKLVRAASMDADEEASDFWEALKAVRLVRTPGRYPKGRSKESYRLSEALPSSFLRAAQSEICVCFQSFITGPQTHSAVLINSREAQDGADQAASGSASKDAELGDASHGNWTVAGEVTSGTYPFQSQRAWALCNLLQRKSVL